MSLFCVSICNKYEYNFICQKLFVVPISKQIQKFKISQILPSLALTHSDVFYQRQFASYNLCIHNAAQDEAIMCFWTQTERKRGADEILSCLHKYILSNYQALENGQNRSLIIWSDRCVG